MGIEAEGGGNVEGKEEKLAQRATARSARRRRPCVMGLWPYMAPVWCWFSNPWASGVLVLWLQLFLRQRQFPARGLKSKLFTLQAS